MSIYNDSIYYVYAYLREDYTPYYIGKGKGSRAYKHHKGMPVPKDKSHIIIIQDNITELKAFILERYYIRWFGRKDNGTGMLRNLTDGGEGNSGLIFTDEHKRNMSECKLGIPLSTEHKKKISRDWLLIDPNGNSIIIKNLNEFCKNNNLDQGALSNISRGKLNHYKGWKCRRLS